MKMTKISDSLPEISRMIIGTWSFGGSAGSYWGEQRQADVDALISTALDLGVNCFDTAFDYNDGNSERALGKALAGKREKAVVIDKMPVQPRELLPVYEKTVTDALKRLDTDYADIIMLHWPEHDAELLKENLRILMELREKGYIREIGASNFGVGALSLAEEIGVKIVLDEMCYNLMTRALEYEVLPYCREQHIGIAPWMPLMQGILSDKYHSIEEIPLPRRRSFHFNSTANPLARHGGGGAEGEVMELLFGLRKLAKENGYGTSQLALAWLLAKEGVVSTIIGCRNEAQVRANAASAETEIDPGLVAELDRISQTLKDKLGPNLDLWQALEVTRVL